MSFEFKVIPAPVRSKRRQQKIEGLDRYASTITELMMEMGLDGWDFVGAELLAEERKGLFFRRQIVERSLLVFRRPLRPLLLTGPETPAPAKAVFSAQRETRKVEPRRLERQDAVARVRAGERKIRLQTPIENVRENIFADGKPKTGHFAAE